MADTNLSNNINLAIIGGSQGFRFIEDATRELTSGVITPFGVSAPIHIIDNNGLDIAYMSRHGEHGYDVTAPFVNYRANIYALKELGVKRIVSWSGPGAIDDSLSCGDIVVPGDIVDETHKRKSTFYENSGLGFIRQNPVFCPTLTSFLRNDSRVMDDNSQVYVCTEGPRLETAAEIRKYSLYGGTLVGMTLAPEAFLARELEICYCPLCYITNYAEGVREAAYEAGKLFEGLATDEELKKVDDSLRLLPKIAASALSETPDTPCSCQSSMQRYKDRGLISDDWHTWITSN